MIQNDFGPSGNRDGSLPAINNPELLGGPSENTERSALANKVLPGFAKSYSEQEYTSAPGQNEKVLREVIGRVDTVSSSFMIASATVLTGSMLCGAYSLPNACELLFHGSLALGLIGSGNMLASLIISNRLKS